MILPVLRALQFVYSISLMSMSFLAINYLIWRRILPAWRTLSGLIIARILVGSGTTLAQLISTDTQEEV